MLKSGLVRKLKRSEHLFFLFPFMVSFPFRLQHVRLRPPLIWRCHRPTYQQWLEKVSKLQTKGKQQKGLERRRRHELILVMTEKKSEVGGSNSGLICVHSKKGYEVNYRWERVKGWRAWRPREEAGEDTFTCSYPSGPPGVSIDPSSTGTCLQGPGEFPVIKGD